MYLVTDRGVTKIYQQDAKTPGNWASISISKLSPLVLEEEFNLAPLGANAARPLWSNLYTWDIKQQKLVLVNNQYPEVFRNRLKEYEHFNANSCEETGQLLSEAYQQRAEEEKVCGETDDRPYVVSKYAKIFLQARMAATRIVTKRENLSHQDFEKMEL